MRTFALALLLSCTVLSPIAAQQFVNKDSDVVTQMYRAGPIANGGTEPNAIAAALLGVSEDPNKMDQEPLVISLKQCAGESLRTYINKRSKKRESVAAVSAYIIHIGEWSVNADGTYSLLTSRWFVYDLKYDRKNNACSLVLASDRANGDPLLYGSKKVRFLGIDHFNYKIHKDQVLVAYKGYATPAQAENITNLGTLAGALLGISNVQNLGSQGYSFTIDGDFTDTFSISHNISGLRRLPFDYNIAPFINVTPWSMTLADANSASQSSISILNPSPNQLISGTQIVTATTTLPAVTKMTLVLDGDTKNKANVTINGPPYSFSFDTSTIAAGRHTLTAMADDPANPGKPTYSVPFPVWVGLEDWKNCDGQPYDQITNLPTGDALKLKIVAGSAPSGFHLVKIGPDMHICGYPDKPGTYNILIQDTAQHERDSTIPIANYAAFALNVQSGSSGNGGGGGGKNGPGGGTASMSLGANSNSGTGGAGKGGGGGGGGASSGQANQQGALPSVTVVDCTQLTSSSPCAFNHTFRSLDHEYWDLSLGVAVPGVRQSNYSTPTATPTVTMHTDAYAFLDIYPAAYWLTKEQWFPHFVVGLPLTSQTFYRPAFGMGENLTAITGLEKRGFPVRIGFFAAVVDMRQQYPTPNPDSSMAAMTPFVFKQARVLKGLYGFEVPVTALVGLIKGAAGGGKSAGGGGKGGGSTGGQ